MKKNVLLITLALLMSVSAFVSLPPRPARANPGLVTAVGNRLVRPDGSSLFVVGANYVGAPDRSWTMWQDGRFDVNIVERDLQRAKAAGANTVRVFVRPPLQQEVLAGRWSKLDAVVDLAERYGLYLIMTLYDYREDDLSKVVPVDKAIASRYAGRAGILAYDLKNEPHYQDLAIAQYPGGTPPLQTDVLIAHYGQQMSQQEVDAWRQTEEGRAHIPSRFSAREAYIYANNYRLYQRFLAEAGDWVTARNYNVSTLDYLDSPDGARWGLLRDALDQTLAAWLKPQVEAVRAGDQARLITVGYSDAVLAGLPTNGSLGFMSIHRFPNVGVKPLLVVFDLLDDLRRIFPNKPVVFEEFGYSNASLDAALTAKYETAMVLQLMSQGMAGGAKWSLYDVAEGFNATQMNYGLYRTDGSAKPVVQALRAIGEYAAATHLTGQLTVEAEGSGSGLRYVYSAADALFVAATSYADGRLSFQAPSGSQVFLSWADDGGIKILSTDSVKLRLDPGALVGAKVAGNLRLERADGTSVSFEEQGETIVFTAVAGESYRLKFDVLAIDARIEIVWPHGNLPVSQAQLANIGAYLFDQGTDRAICPNLMPTVRLWRALNNGVEELVGVGERRTASLGGLVFNAWDFNNVDVSAATNASNKYYFRLSVDGYRHCSSIWSHAVDARTYMPNPDIPTGISSDTPGLVDAKIEIVWPHGSLPVDQATKANVGVYLFKRGTLQTVPPDWTPVVRLWRALNNGQEEQVAVGNKVMKQIGDLRFPTWEFNDIDVSAARDPLNKYYFRVTVDGVDCRGNVWAHGADARTYFPEQDVPSGVVGCN